jgi:DNA-binding transcriptional LysR family regulator
VTADPDIRPLIGRLKLRQIALVVALDLHRSLRRAADAIAVTQPAATRLLRDLEQAFGAALFVRHPWGMEPTPAGEALTRYARILLTEVGEAQTELRLLAAGARGVLRIGCVTGAVPGWLVPAARAVRRSRPGLRLTMLVNTSDMLIDELLAGTLDVAIGRLTEHADPALLSIVTLGDEPLCIVARRGHPLAQRRRVSARDLEGATWILQTPGSPMRQESGTLFDRLGVQLPADVIETASIVATGGLLRDTDALSVMPLDLAEHYGAWLVRLKVGDARAESRYDLITRRGRALAPAALAFVEEVQALARARRRHRSTSGHVGVRP